MSLNIKNERVHQLARDAARVTQKTQTGAIEEALVLLLTTYGSDPEEAARQAKLARLREVGRGFDRLPVDPNLEISSIEDLYDEETGLPR